MQERINLSLLIIHIHARDYMIFPLKIIMILFMEKQNR